MTGVADALLPWSRGISDGEFAQLQALIHRETGIYLSPAKKALLVGRLGRRLRALGLTSFGAYYETVVDDDGGAERVRMLDCICTNETSFFREPRQFELLEHRIVQELAARAAQGHPKRVRVWSAACSTGEEPYSIAMVLLDHLKRVDAWDIEIIATDLSTRALDKAAQALWPIARAAEVPERYLKRYMLRGIRSQHGMMTVTSEVRDVVTFQRLNLNDPNAKLPGCFDLIFCRNVLIYFNVESKVQVVSRLLRRLAAWGYLFLGHAESLSGMGAAVRVVQPNVYQPAPLRERDHE